MEPAAIAIIFNDKDEVLILERMEPQRDWSGYWGFPGGGINPDESAYGAAVRETKEETNLNVHNLKYIRRERGFLEVFMSRDFDGDIDLSFEHSDHAWVSLRQLNYYKLIPGSKVLIEEAIIL
jgi:8-oxo-dGTP diphosphatase